MRLPPFPTILLSFSMLATVTAVPKPASSLSPGPGVITTLLTPRSLKGYERGPGLSAEFIATMGPQQLVRLKSDIFLAFGLGKLNTRLNEPPLVGDLQDILWMIESAEGLPNRPTRFTGDLLAPELARLLRQYGDTVWGLPNRDMGIMRMKIFFSLLRPEQYPPPSIN